MDTVIVRLTITPVGLGFSTLLQVLKGDKNDRILRILNIKPGPDSVQITTDDRVLTFKRSDWPRFDDLINDLIATHENGYREKYRVFR